MTFRSAPIISAPQLEQLINEKQDLQGQVEDMRSQTENMQGQLDDSLAKTPAVWRIWEKKKSIWQTMRDFWRAMPS